MQGGAPVGGVPTCVYVFPLPECAESLSAAELDAWKNKPVLDMVAEGCGEPEEEDEDGEVEDGEDDGGDVFEDPPAERPEFGDEPCRSFGFSVRENIPAGDNVFPGVAMADRYDEDLPGNDLAAVAPHALTASPPRRVGDSAGCADGVETRSTHSDADRKNTNTTPTGSAFGDATAPPGADSPRYAAARVNFAHRAASWVAEHDCSALKAEAEYLRQLGLNQLQSMVDRVEALKTDAGTVVGALARYSPGSDGSGFLGGLGNINRAKLETYANDKKAKAEEVMTAAETAAADLVEAGSSLPAVSNRTGIGCKNGYEMDNSAIAAAISNARTAANNALTPVLRGYWDVRTPNLDSYTTNTGPETFSAASVAPEPEKTNEMEASTDTTPAVVEPAGWAIDEADMLIRPLRCEDGSYQTGTDSTYGAPVCEREITPSSTTTTPASVTCTWSQTRTKTFPDTLTYPGATGSVSRTRTQEQTRSAVANVRDSTDCGTMPAWSDWSDSGPETVSQWSPLLGSTGGQAFPPETVIAFRMPGFDAYNSGKRSARKTDLLQELHPNSPDRVSLTSAEVENITLSPGLNGVTSEPMLDTDLASYQTGYKMAYQTGFDNVLADLGGADILVWSGLGWSYDAESLRWDRYTVETRGWCDGTQPRGGAGVLLNVSLDGEVGVGAERLDFETGQINGAVLPQNDDPPPSRQVECKIIRDRTPVVDLKYEPVWDGPRWSALSSSLDSTGLGVLEFDMAALRREYDLFQLDISLSDAPPILCHTSYDINDGSTVFRVASSAGAGVDVTF